MRQEVFVVSGLASTLEGLCVQQGCTKRSQAEKRRIQKGLHVTLHLCSTAEGHVGSDATRALCVSDDVQQASCALRGLQSHRQKCPPQTTCTSLMCRAVHATTGPKFWMRLSCSVHVRDQAIHRIMLCPVDGMAGSRSCGSLRVRSTHGRRNLCPGWCTSVLRNCSWSPPHPKPRLPRDLWPIQRLPCHWC